ncbi:uncharacterized protein TNCV_3888701 [Trichonephila clavipes]|nr:uncharacterized protein TNCV_3888701 [Trichonephila clavipes]
MAPHNFLPAVGKVCRCKSKAGLRHSHTDTIVITAETESGFLAKDDLVPFHYSPVFSCRAPLQTEASMRGVKGSTRNGHHDPKLPSTWRLRMVRKDIGGPS